MENTKKKLDLRASFEKGFHYFKNHWNTPPEGRFLSIREWVCYCLGGMGALGATVLPNYIALIAGLYIAVALNISVWHITLLGIIGSVINIVRAPLIATIVDNVNTKRFGKFRVWLVYMSLPILILLTATAWVPALIAFNTPIVNPATTYVLVLVSYAILSNCLQFCMQLYSVGFSTMLQVISPNPKERTNLMSFGVFVYSLGPSILQIALPFIANVLFSYNGQNANGINNIKTSLYIVPAFGIILLGLGLLVAFGTKERTVLAKNKKQKLNMWDGLKKLSKNKYFWLNLSGNILGVFRLMGTSFVAWICAYMINSSYAQSIATTVMGLACNPGMLLAPLVINKIGKKKLVILSNLCVAAATVPMIILAATATSENTVVTGVLLLLVSFFITVCYSFQIVTQPAMLAQVLDYQQLRTGDRVEGMVHQFSAMISSIVGIGTAYMSPAIYSAFGYKTDASVLYNVEMTLGPIIMVMCIIGTVSAVLSAVPFFFWDIDEKRHQQIMDILKVRANLADGLCDTDTATKLEESINAGEQHVLDYFKESEAEVSATDNSEEVATANVTD